MALVVKDRVRETSTTAGTGTFTLAGAVTGYQAFSAVGDGNTTYYTIYLQGGNEWEVGIGTYTASGTTLSRDTILASSNAGSAVNFSAGTKDVFVTYPAGRSVWYDSATNVTLNALTLSGGTQNGVLYLNASKVATSGSALTFDGTILNNTGAAPGIRTTLTGGLSYTTVAYDGVYATGTDLYLFAPTGKFVSIYANNAEQMRLTSTGVVIRQSSNSANTSVSLNTTIQNALTLEADGDLLVGTTTNTNSSKLVASGTISETVSSTQYLVASQFDIGTAANEIPLNQYLGNLAYQDAGSIAGQVGLSAGTAALPSLVSATDTDTGMWFPAANTLAWSTGGTERVRIDSSGNLGLGGVAPSAWGSGRTAIQVYGSSTAAYFAGGTFNTYFSTNYYYNSGDKFIGATNYASYYTQSYLGQHQWWTSSAASSGADSTATMSQLMTLDSLGNLGVGTSSPNYLIHSQTTSTNITTNLKVNADAAANNYAEIAFQLWSGAGTGLNTFGGGGNSRPSVVLRALSEDNSARGAFVVATFSGGDTNATLTEKARITSDGNLGIGTNAPSDLLHLNRNTTTATVQRITNTGGTALIGVENADGTGILSGAGAYDTAIRTASGTGISFGIGYSSPAMRLNSSGNLGLGVTPSLGDIYYRKFELGKVGCGLTAATTSLTSSELTYLTGNAYARYTGGNPWVYGNDGPAGIYGIEDGTHSWYNAPSGTANTTTITNLVSYTIITSGNQTDFGAANNNVGTVFTANASGTLSSGTVSQNISFSQRMTLDASGNLGIGQTNPSTWLVNGLGIGSGANDWGATIYTGTASTGYLCFADGATGLDRYRGYISYAHAINTMFFATDANERARITSGGYFKASNNGAYIDAVSGTYHELNNNAADDVIRIRNSNASNPYGIDLNFSGASPDNNTQYFLLCRDNAGGGVGTNRCFIYSDGDLANHDGVYGTISDQKLKQDIVDAGSQWADIKAIRFRKYRMKSDVAVNPDAPALLGVVAQELEQVSPGLVDEHPDMETVEVTDEDGNVTQTQQPTGTTTKTVKSSILLMKAAVALQEAMARIEKLEAEVAALKGA